MDNTDWTVFHGVFCVPKVEIRNEDESPTELEKEKLISTNV